MMKNITKLLNCSSLFFTSFNCKYFKLIKIDISIFFLHLNSSNIHQNCGVFLPLSIHPRISSLIAITPFSTSGNICISLVQKGLGKLIRATQCGSTFPVKFYRSKIGFKNLSTVLILVCDSNYNCPIYLF